MSLIKTKLVEDRKKQEAIEEAKLELLTYVMFGSLSPMNPARSMNDQRYSQL